MKRVCNQCDAEYSDHAEYCNACGAEDFRVVAEAADNEPPAPVRSDGQALWMGAILWLIGLGYLLTVRRPRDLLDLATGWAFLTAFTVPLGLVLRNLRATMLFSVLAIPFLAAFWWIKLA